MSAWSKAAFKRYVTQQAQNLNVEFTSITVRHMEQKWASCSAKGNLTFNSDLLNMDKEVGQYVVVHELMHLRVPNHGKLWKAYMISLLGDYREAERRIRLIANCKIGEM